MGLLLRVVAALALSAAGCATEPPPVILVPVPPPPRCEGGALLDVSDFIEDPVAPRRHTIVIGGGHDSAYLDPLRRPPSRTMAYVDLPDDAWGEYGSYTDYVVASPGWGTGVGHGFHGGWHGSPGGHATGGGSGGSHGGSGGSHGGSGGSHGGGGGSHGGGGGSHGHAR
jgi:hypothetical protein